jgi:hypothetical protein
LPLQDGPAGQVRLVTLTYLAIHHILTNPVCAGAYAYGKSRCEPYVDEYSAAKKCLRHVPREQWAVAIPDYHPGFIGSATFQAIQARLDASARPQPHQSGGAVREGSAFLQGLATCGHCGRRLHPHYRGRNATPDYDCTAKDLVNGRGLYCLNVGGLGIDKAAADAFLEAMTPGAVENLRLSVEQLQANHEAALSQWGMEVERMLYEAELAEPRYRAATPENRLVTRGLEAEWEYRLRDLVAAEAELHRRDEQRSRSLTPDQA